MTWQEWIFSAGNVVFLVTLLPTMANRKAYVPRWTSAPIAGMLALYTLAFVSYGMVLASTFCVGTVGAWAFVFRYRGVPPERQSDDHD